MTSDQRPFDVANTLTQGLDVDFALQAAGLGVWEVDLATNQVIWDDRCRQLFGLAKDNQLPYPLAIQYIHPQDRERVDGAVQWVLNPESDGRYDQTYRTLGADDGKLRWVRFQGKSYFSPAGALSRFTGIAQDVTEPVQALHIKEESQRQLLALFEQSPVALAILSADEDLVFQWANTFYGELVDRAPQALVGKPLLEALPELKGQGFDGVLKAVIATGTPFVAPEVAADILRDGQLATLYVSVTYQPQKTPQGEVEGILVVATDVTQQAQSRKVILDREALFQKLVSQAPMGICVLDAATLIAENLNERFVDVAGRPYEAILGNYYWDTFAEVAFLFEDILRRVIETGETYYDDEVQIELIRHGKPELIYINYVYDAIRDQAGKTQKVVVWVVDVTTEVRTRQQLAESETRYRLLSETLEQQVQQRTVALATANNELVTKNEAYRALNKELHEANFLLKRSNESLQTFAYVASHDLQEPLRKIQQFGDLLKTGHAEARGGELGYVERMQSAAGRMSVLIKDLLDYSRIANQPDTSAPVALDQVVDAALIDLELLRSETQARIEVNPLPVVVGHAGQLGQLFQNLLSNALKFRRPDVTACIQIKFDHLSSDQLPPTVKPSRSSPTYYRVDVIDNGIGFDEKYVDRIFEVFQRLHGKREYAGTGIGLAICEKVVANHGGAITARSQPGQGATFSIYLPAQLEIRE